MESVKQKKQFGIKKKKKKKKKPNLCSKTGQNVGGGDQIERTSHTHTRVGFIT